MFCIYKLCLLITVCIVDNTQVHSNISSLSFNTEPIPGHVFNYVMLSLAIYTCEKANSDVVEQEYTGEW